MNLLDQQQDNQDDPNKDYWKELTSEGGKFYDPDENKAKQKLARGKWESDNYIKTVERKNDELIEELTKLREEANKQAGMQELLDRMMKQPQDHENRNVNEDQNRQPQFDPKQLESLVSTKIQEHETSRKQAENYAAVQAKLKERFGSNYQNVLRQEMEQLGLDEQYLNDMARNRPQVFYRTFGLDQPQQTENFQAPPRGSTPFKPVQEKRTWDWYQKMKRDNPKLYYDPKTTVQMHNDAQALGLQEFYGGRPPA